MNHHRISLLAFVAFATLGSAIAQPSIAKAAPFTPGDLVVYRAGDGVSTLANTGNSVFIDEYSLTGTLVQSVPMPTVASGSNLPFYASGTATSEGGLTVSPNGKYIAVTGYGGTSTSPTSLASSTLPRVVGIVNASTGAIDTSTAPTDFAVGNNPRSAVTIDGNSIWMAGAAGGVRYSTIGNTSTSTMVSPSPGTSNFRQVNIFGGQLYVTGSSGGATFGSLGTGLPTAANQTFTQLPGFPTTSDTEHLNPYAFFFADLTPTVPGVDTLYVADNTTHTGVNPAPAGGITKYSLVGGVWQSNGTVDDTNSNYQGLTGIVQNNGSVKLFATKGDNGNVNNGLYIASLTDSTGYNGALSGTPTTIATAGTNEAFRGIGALSVTGLPGDLNLDGHVNAADIKAMSGALTGLSSFQSSNSLNNYGLKSIADVDGDGQVTNADMQALLNKMLSGGGNTTSVPEPASIALAALGFVGLSIVAGRKVRKT